jgi:CubicO group peptidase (beta-lactamase class C family)
MEVHGMFAPRRFASIVPICALLSLTVTSLASVDPPERTSEGEAIHLIRDELRTESAADQFSGAVSITKSGQPVLEEAVGLADRDRKIPNTVGTKFRFGSMGKMFTAVAILQLIEAGKVKLDDPLSKYLPGYPNHEVAAVTIHQLLTHTGGTGDIFSPEYFERRNQVKELSDYIGLYGTRGVQFPPGSRWDYSNYGFILLGRVIEVVTGHSYYDYVRDNIFKPAGMNSTGNLPEETHIPNLAVAYTRHGGTRRMLMPPGNAPPSTTDTPASDAPPPLESADALMPYRGTSAGGGYSTVTDLARFSAALRSYKLLNAHFTGLLTTGKVKTGRPATQYAYGFEDQTTPDGIRYYGHGGGAPGINGRLMIFPDSGYTVVVLSNLDPPSADNIARFIRERLPLR